MAVCLHFQPERKLNWKTLREKRQRLEDLSDLEQRVLKLAFPRIISSTSTSNTSKYQAKEQTGLDRSRVPMGQGVGPEGPRASKGRPTGS